MLLLDTDQDLQLKLLYSGQRDFKSVGIAIHFCFKFQYDLCVYHLDIVEMAVYMLYFKLSQMQPESETYIQVIVLQENCYFHPAQVLLGSPNDITGCLSMGSPHPPFQDKAYTINQACSFVLLFPPPIPLFLA